MTVSELIAAWTPEERERFTDLIAECLQREENLNLCRAKMEKNNKELGKSLDHLISGIASLAQGAEACNHYLQDVYLKVAKPTGSA